MEKNLSNHFEYIVDFMSLGNQQLMYLDEKKNVKFIYEKDFLHFGKANVFVRLTHNKRGHILFFDDENTRHLLYNFEGKYLCRKSANFYNI